MKLCISTSVILNIDQQAKKFGFSYPSVAREGKSSISILVSEIHEFLKAMQHLLFLTLFFLVALSSVEARSSNSKLPSVGYKMKNEVSKD